MAGNKKCVLLSLRSPLFGYSNVDRWYIPVVTVMTDADSQQVDSCFCSVCWSTLRLDILIKEDESCF